MLQLLDLVNEFKKEEKTNDIDKQAETDNVLNNADRTIEDIVMDLTKNSKDFFAFAYELIKQDKSCEHVIQILNGNVAQPIMVEIIMSNQYNEQKKEMTVKPNHYFKMNADVGYRTLSFHKSGVAGNKNSQPTMIEFENNQDKDVIANVQFKLDPQGIQILCDGKMLSCSQEAAIKPGQSTGLKIEHAIPKVNGFWHFVPQENRSTNPYYTIELGYGEKRPRMVCGK